MKSEMNRINEESEELMEENTNLKSEIDENTNHFIVYIYILIYIYIYI